MEIYEVEIEERLVRVIRKEAASACEAERAVKKEWEEYDDEKYILDAGDFFDVSFTARLCKTEKASESQ